jgi:23S rRNA (uracil1939-C5)-methyltransferase
VNPPIASAAGTAECPHFGHCGGCQFLDIAYEAELQRKHVRFAAAIAAVPVLAGVSVAPILRAEKSLGWRTSLKVPFGRRRGGAVCGFFARGSHEIVDLKTCLIQDPALVELLIAVRAQVRHLRVPIYDEVAHTGVLRHLVARIAAGTGEIGVGLVVREPGHVGIRELAQGIWRSFEAKRVVGVIENVNGARTNVILGPRFETLHGRAWLEEESDSLHVQTPFHVFAQVNNTQAPVLYAEVLRLLGDVRGRHVLDLYSGYGPLALRLARAGARVHAVERDAAAVRAGMDAAARHDLAGRIQFTAADVENALAGGDLAAADAAVVDPPRRGLTAGVVEQLLRHPRLGVLVYVSCNPKTLVRDLELLAQRFTVESVRAVDMFPRTDHIEAVVLLRGREA